MASGVAEEERKDFTFFWKSHSPFSQWHLAGFTIDGITFNCAEQYMMYQKAVLFGDKEIADEILKTTSPRAQKSLGQKVKNFDQERWDRNCKDIVKNGNLAKFQQNTHLKKALMKTGSTTLVEASPHDTIWGVGLSEKDPRCCDKKKWRGTNWLGYILTDVRTELASLE